MPQADTLLIGRLPPAGWAATGEGKTEAPQIIDVEGTHPLMHLIDLGNVRFAEGMILKPPEGATTLITADAGPLLAIAPRGTFEDAVLGAEIVGTDAEGRRFANTDWPLRVSFPVFVLNALNYFGGAAAGDGVATAQPGETVPLRGAGATGQLTIRTPGGKRVTLASGAGSSIHFSDTEQTGIYEVEEAGQPPRYFAVNLFDGAESRIEPRAAVEIGYDKVSGQASWEGGARSYGSPFCWRYYACCAWSGISTIAACTSDVLAACPPDSRCTMTRLKSSGADLHGKVPSF